MIPTIVVPDSLWSHWITNWKDTWELDEDPSHFFRNVALVISRSRYNDNPDVSKKEQTGVFDGNRSCPRYHSLGDSRRGRSDLEKTEPDRQSVICLTLLHKFAKFFPGYYSNRNKKNITLQHMKDRTAAAGMASNFAGAELL